MIVDTGDLSGPGDLRGLAEILRIASAVDLADLGWLRQVAFRALLAGIFDPPVGAESLGRLRRVRLDCARHGAATAQLLLGWLASRLEWPHVTRAGGGWRAGDVAIELVVRDVDAGRDGIYQILLETDRGEAFSITDSGPEWLEVKAAGLPTRTVAAPDAARSDAELVVAALGARGHDPLFAQALRRAAELES
jgi:glucose-6-phosphate dehydrogenase assembly protein OpcA